MSRITNDIETINQAISFALVNVLSGSLLIVWVAIKMLTLSWSYALVSMAVVPLMIVATFWISGQARKAFRVTRVEIGKVNANLEESIAGVRDVQAFNREEVNIEAFRESNASNRDANIKAVSFTAVSAHAEYVLPKISQISVLWTNIQNAVAGAERIFELMDTIPGVQDIPGAQALPEIKGEVVFDNVSAQYVPGELVLKGVSFKAEPGQTIALVGQTGAGKTTIINLIPRFYDVVSGKIAIDGYDVSKVASESLRRQIGIVLQDTFIFNDTVMNNIRLGKPDASDEDVLAAARLSHADDFIQRLPEGYNAVLGEHGAGLSQGQRQLIAIARAALTDPRILILDEATSSVDTRTERLIQKALETLLKGRTSFVVAHRLSTIRNADQVLVIDGGEIVERGTHASLLAQKGVYYTMYQRQFRKEEPEKVGGNGKVKADGHDHPHSIHLRFL